MSSKLCTSTLSGSLCGVELIVGENWFKSSVSKGIYRCSSCEGLRRRAYKQSNPERTLLNTARNGAKRRGLGFMLALEDICIPAVCPLLGIPLVWDAYGKPYSDNTPSLDRKDSSKGYTPENVWVVSWLANKIMATATAEQVRTVARNIYRMEAA